MKRKGTILVLVAALVMIASTLYADDDLMERAQKRFKPVPKAIPELKGKSFRTAWGQA